MAFYTVRIKLASQEDAAAWFEDARAAGLTPDCGLRHLEFGDVEIGFPPAEVPLVIVAEPNPKRPRAWVVEPKA
jgi:hypothetical protein